MHTLSDGKNNYLVRSFGQAVHAELQEKEYEGEEAKEWSLNIADTIREGVKALNVPRQESRHLLIDNTT